LYDIRKIIFFCPREIRALNLAEFCYQDLRVGEFLALINNSTEHSSSQEDDNELAKKNSSSFTGFNSILILPSLLNLILPSGLFPSDFSYKIIYEFLTSPCQMIVNFIPISLNTPL
jgi:hypothetical protein